MLICYHSTRVLHLADMLYNNVIIIHLYVHTTYYHRVHQS